MALRGKYRFCREGGWNLWLLSESWDNGLRGEVLHQVESLAPPDRAQIKKLRYPPEESGAEFYLKIYRGACSWGAVKDLLRDSKAFRALKQGEVLRELGFHVPVAVAAGEKRNRGFLERAFLLTVGVKGLPLHLFLQERCSPPLELEALRKKRECLKLLALEIRRLHQHGFVHGDLTPTNILVEVEGGKASFFFVDNDRTLRYPPWFPQLLWRRNLVQLNRFALPGISLQDRLRFLRSYLGRRRWRKSDLRLIRWLEERTRKRLQEFHPIEPGMSFRKLVQWDGPFAKTLHGR